jgi:hypothetical protein
MAFIVVQIIWQYFNKIIPNILQNQNHISMYCDFINTISVQEFHDPIYLDLYYCYL